MISLEKTLTVSSLGGGGVIVAIAAGRAVDAADSNLAVVVVVVVDEGIGVTGERGGGLHQTSNYHGFACHDKMRDKIKTNVCTTLYCMH
jgi:hypothetical protein